MNLSMIIFVMGWILIMEGALMLLPAAVSLIYMEKSGLYILLCLCICLALGFVITRKKPKNNVFYAREGFVTVALGWIVLSVFGALPFYISGEIPSYVNALFEVISGFTTTGASILDDVEGLSHGMLMWRSFTHWIGGMGVLVFLLAVLPMAGGYGMHIMKAESPGPSVGKMVPRVRQTAKILYLIYFAMTVLEFILLLLSGMPWFDSLAMSVGTAGTGGFGVLADSCASYTTLQQAILSIFMIAFGVNFNVYYLFLIRKPKDALRCEEMRWYLGIIFASAFVIAVNIFRAGFFSSFFMSFHHALFQVATVITTTGFATADFDLWPEFSKTILVVLMFVGACAGSTGGGTKVSRVVITVKSIGRELSSLIHPRSVKTIKFEGRPVDNTLLSSISAYYMAYILIYIVSLLAVSVDNFDFTTNFTAVAATFNNIGPGLAKVGPTCNFNIFSDFPKLVLMFDMLAGRLEVFPMLLLFSAKTWMKKR